MLTLKGYTFKKSIREIVCIITPRNGENGIFYSICNALLNCAAFQASRVLLADSISSNSLHVLNGEFQLLPSNRQFIFYTSLFCCLTKTSVQLMLCYVWLVWVFRCVCVIKCCFIFVLYACLLDESGLWRQDEFQCEMTIKNHHSQCWAVTHYRNIVTFSVTSIVRYYNFSHSNITTVTYLNNAALLHYLNTT